MRILRVLTAPVLLLAASCIDTDAAVFVDATIDTASVTVGDELLGTTLTGSFQLTLHLGARASGPSQVTFGTFSIVDAASGAVIVDSLPVTSSQSAPVTVEPGGADTAVTFTIDLGADLLPQEAADQLCAGEVQITAVLQDSLATTSTPAESEPFLVGGC